MKRNISWLALMLALSACGGSEPSTNQTTNQTTNQSTNQSTTADAAAEADTIDKSTTSTSPDKPGAPIYFRYEVQGKPIVGHPVAINILVSSTVHGAPISVSYRVNDSSAMAFPASQALRTEFTTAPGDEPTMQQITVIPQKEGRLYVNVSAEIQTENGSMIKSQAIPIQVGSAPPELKSNGELTETADGDTVVSMPSD